MRQEAEGSPGPVFRSDPPKRLDVGCMHGATERLHGLLRTDGNCDLVAIPVGAFAVRDFPESWVSVWEARRHSWVMVPQVAERSD